jgi:uncharacterized membrane protein (UPF0182 family)
MAPSRRDNMIAWLAARCDPPDYGKLIVYEFPKEKLVYGPFQIEALINQNTYISRQLSLWNQMGSRVIRGNLLVIPIENSILSLRRDLNMSATNITSKWLRKFLLETEDISEVSDDIRKLV